MGSNEETQAVVETEKVRKPRGRPKGATKAKGVTRPRRQVPFADAAINARRAFEAAVRLGARDDFDGFRIAYGETSRRRKAKLNNPEYLRRRLAELEACEKTVEKLINYCPEGETGPRFGGIGKFPENDTPQITHWETSSLND